MRIREQPEQHEQMGLFAQFTSEQSDNDVDSDSKKTPVTEPETAEVEESDAEFDRRSDFGFGNNSYRKQKLRGAYRNKK